MRWSRPGSFFLCTSMDSEAGTAPSVTQTCQRVPTPPYQTLTALWWSRKKSSLAVPRKSPFPTVQEATPETVRNGLKTWSSGAANTKTGVTTTGRSPDQDQTHLRGLNTTPVSAHPLGGLVVPQHQSSATQQRTFLFWNPCHSPSIVCRRQAQLANSSFG